MQTRIILQNGELLRLDRHEHYSVSCESGEAWITISGVSRDIILHGKERARLAPGVALIEGHGELQIIPAPPGWAYRLLLASARSLLTLARHLRRRPRVAAPICLTSDRTI